MIFDRINEWNEEWDENHNLCLFNDKCLILATKIYIFKSFVLLLIAHWGWKIVQPGWILKFNEQNEQWDENHKLYLLIDKCLILARKKM